MLCLRHSQPADAPVSSQEACFEAWCGWHDGSLAVVAVPCDAAALHSLPFAIALPSAPPPPPPAASPAARKPHSAGSLRALLSGVRLSFSGSDEAPPGSPLRSAGSAASATTASAPPSPAPPLQLFLNSGVTALYYDAVHDQLWAGSESGELKVLRGRDRRLRLSLATHLAAVVSLVADDEASLKLWSASRNFHVVAWDTAALAPLCNVVLAAEPAWGERLTQIVPCGDLLLACAGKLLVLRKEQLSRPACVVDIDPLADESRRLLLDSLHPAASPGGKEPPEEAANVNGGAAIQMHTPGGGGSSSSATTTTTTNGGEATAFRWTAPRRRKDGSNSSTPPLSPHPAPGPESPQPYQQLLKLRPEASHHRSTESIDDGRVLQCACAGVNLQFWCVGRYSNVVQVYQLTHPEQLAVDGPSPPTTPPKCLRRIGWACPCEAVNALHKIETNLIWAAGSDGAVYLFDGTLLVVLLAVRLHSAPVFSMAHVTTGTDTMLVSWAGRHDQNLVVYPLTRLLRGWYTVGDGGTCFEVCCSLGGLVDDVFGFPRLLQREDGSVEAVSVGESELPAYPHTILAVDVEQLYARSLVHRARWDAMLTIGSDDDVLGNNQQELVSLCRQGIPIAERPRVWWLLIVKRVQQMRRFKGEDYYRRILDYKADRQPPEAQQIEMDLERTFPDNPRFKGADSADICALRRILTAFAWHNPNIGYCQGLNKLAAFALLVLQEEEAFWAMLAVVEEIMRFEYYRFPLVGSQVDQLLFLDLVSAELPEMAAHFSKLSFALDSISFRWFFTAFVSSVPFRLTLRVWDAYLAEGRPVLFRYGLAVLALNRDAILGSKSFEDLHAFFRSLALHPLNVDAVTKLAFEGLNVNVEKAVREKQEQYRELVIGESKTAVLDDD